MTGFWKGQLPLDDRRLRIVCEVIACNGVRAAAERLELDPSVISRNVGQAEEHLGIALFDRVGRQLRPTAAGMVLFEFIRERRVLHDDLLQRLDDIRGLRAGSIGIAAGEGFLPELLREPIGSFQKSHPNIVVRLEAMTVDAMIEVLTEGEFEIGLAHNPPPHPAIRSVHKRSLPIDVVVPPGSPLLRGRSAMRVPELVGHPIGLMKAGYGLQKAVEALEYAERVKLKPNLVTNSLAALKAYVSAGLGITLMPAAMVRAERERGDVAILPLDHPIARNAELHLLVRRGRELSRPGAQLLANLNQYMTRFKA